MARCFAAIRAGAPNVPLEGPDSVSAPTWLAEYAKKEVGTVSWLGFHYYPLGCGLDGKRPAQAASILLSPALAAEEAATFAQAATDAETADAQLWMTETQSACGGGAQGVSDSYATALWVVDYLLTGAEHGVNGMNFHGGFNIGCESYTPLCQVGTNEYSARPIYYGMLFTHLLGAGHLLPVTVSSARNVAAFALKPQSGGGLRLIVENLSPYQIDATLRTGGNPGTATVLHMTGPSLLATSGVRIQNAVVGDERSHQSWQTEHCSLHVRKLPCLPRSVHSHTSQRRLGVIRARLHQASFTDLAAARLNRTGFRGHPVTGSCQRATRQTLLVGGRARGNASQPRASDQGRGGCGRRRRYAAPPPRPIHWDQPR